MVDGLPPIAAHLVTCTNGKAAPLRRKGGKRAGKGKIRYVINIRCLLATGMELIFSSLFHRKTYAECAVEDDAEGAKGIPKNLTP